MSLFIFVILEKEINGMLGDVQNVCCSICGKYLFTEKDTDHGYRRECDKQNYIYNQIKATFICEECNKMSKL